MYMYKQRHGWPLWPPWALMGLALMGRALVGPLGPNGLQLAHLGRVLMGRALGP